MPAYWDQDWKTGPATFKPGRCEMSKKKKQKENDNQDDIETKPDWSGKCEVCGASPIVPVTGMCGPCTFGEADTAQGNW